MSFDGAAIAALQNGPDEMSREDLIREVAQLSRTCANQLGIIHRQEKEIHALVARLNCNGAGADAGATAEIFGAQRQVPNRRSGQPPDVITAFQDLEALASSTEPAQTQLQSCMQARSPNYTPALLPLGSFSSDKGPFETGSASIVGADTSTPHLHGGSALTEDFLERHGTCSVNQSAIESNPSMRLVPDHHLESTGAAVQVCAPISSARSITGPRSMLTNPSTSSQSRLQPSRLQSMGPASVATRLSTLQPHVRNTPDVASLITAFNNHTPLAASTAAATSSGQLSLAAVDAAQNAKRISHLQTTEVRQSDWKSVYSRPFSFTPS